MRFGSLEGSDFPSIKWRGCQFLWSLDFHTRLDHLVRFFNNRSMSPFFVHILAHPIAIIYTTYSGDMCYLGDICRLVLWYFRLNPTILHICLLFDLNHSCQDPWPEEATEVIETIIWHIPISRWPSLKFFIGIKVLWVEKICVSQCTGPFILNHVLDSKDIVFMHRYCYYFYFYWWRRPSRLSEAGSLSNGE